MSSHLLVVAVYQSGGARFAAVTKRPKYQSLKNRMSQYLDYAPSPSQAVLGN